MRVRTHADLDRLRASVERTRRLSDRVIGLGPFGLGLDGVLAWIPGAGLLYSLAAGGFLLVQGARAQVAPRTLGRMIGLLAADSLTDVIPIPLAPALADMVFTGHKWAADALLKGMEETIYYPGSKRDAEHDPRFREILEQVRTGEDPRRRVVFLG